MYIEKLTLNNYRNYESLDMDFSRSTNILFGDNAQGKTNILEALYVGSTTKSHRSAKDRDIIKFEEEEAHIRINLKKREVPHKIDMHLRKGKAKQVSIDGLSIKRAAELFGLVNIIFFSPEDLSIIKNGPGERRRFMDMEICQLSRIYFSNLANYNKVLDHRNHLLKDIIQDRSLTEMLDVWDMQLVSYGKEVIRERREFVEMLNDIIQDIHSTITSGKETIKLIYEANVSEDDFETVLSEKRNIDIRNASTMTGPQRDDIGIFIDGNDVRTFGSQGQQRTAALSLKLAEIELVRRMIKDDPILLLDDVMSELDSKRRNQLLKSIEGIQTVITCTGYEDFIRERISLDKIFEVEMGKVKEVGIREND